MKYSPKVDKFIAKIRSDLALFDCKVILLNREYVKCDKSLIKGYFDFDKKKLVCAVGAELDNWFPILIHEYCHFLQWLEGAEEYEMTLSFTADFDSWIYEGKKVSKEALENSFEVFYNMELDCEKRILEIVELYNLPVDLELYTKKANAYLAYLQVAFEKGSWGSGEETPYFDQEVIEAAPKKMYDKDQKIAQNLKSKIRKYCYENSKSTTDN